MMVPIIIQVVLQHSDEDDEGANNHSQVVLQDSDEDDDGANNHNNQVVLQDSDEDDDGANNHSQVVLQDSDEDDEGANNHSQVVLHDSDEDDDGANNHSQVVLQDSDEQGEGSTHHGQDMATGRANAPAVLADRGRIIGLWQGGMAPADVADAMGVSKKTVQRWITRWQEEGSLTTRPRSCRPRLGFITLRNTCGYVSLTPLPKFHHLWEQMLFPILQRRHLMPPCNTRHALSSSTPTTNFPHRVVLVNPYPNSQLPTIPNYPCCLDLPARIFTGFGTQTRLFWLSGQSGLWPLH
ncbi:Replicase polyprotein 1a-like 16 [Homarus americanus]|uniref:Replicase polyprotein 1a-like 16 n=1 Tax=Homarus americanus TaxID=6706 RepID=A0A8J5JHS3_HOMAM|nr:Replicase polyprotein 1a-like 16 [Homarus americanus]